MQARGVTFVAASILVLLPAWVRADQSDKDQPSRHRFRVTSSSFDRGGALPLANAFNQCPYYPGGSDESPALSWSHAPEQTRSFVVIAYDTDASFTHWGMYNIPQTTTSLAENAGVAGSSVGIQVSNDFGDLSYDGPCPPPTFTPVNHHYVFTVYALDEMLPVLPTSGDFPPGAEALYHALIKAARDGHILATASVDAFFPNVD
jgi:Raf kinase inhibitor-like YbhB/YbcL family protein